MWYHIHIQGPFKLSKDVRKADEEEGGINLHEKEVWPIKNHLLRYTTTKF